MVFVHWRNVMRLAGAFGIVKGTLISVVLSVLDITFWKQLVIALLSAGIGFAGVVLAAVITIRETRRNRSDLRSIKRAVGANRRLEDEDDEEASG